MRFVPVCKRQYLVETVEAERFAHALPQGERPDLVRLVLTGESRAAPDLAALAAQAAPASSMWSCGTAPLCRWNCGPGRRRTR